MKKQILKIYWTKGLPASGKSTWARQWVNEAPKERVRINRDDIRNMLGPYWIPQREDLVTDIEKQSVLHAIEEGFHVVVDATNFRGVGKFESIEDYNGISLRNREDIEFECKDFTDVPLKTCIQRDANRTDGHVTEEVIRRMADKYL